MSEHEEDNDVGLSRRELLKAAAAAALVPGCAAAVRGHQQSVPAVGAPVAAAVADPMFASASEVLEALAKKQLSSVELTKMCFARIRKLDKSIHAVILLREQQALAEAAAADQARARGDWRHKPLLGLPVTLKEAFNVEGLQTTWGDPKFTSNIAKTDSVAAARYRGAGAVILGKTNIAFMLGGYDSNNPAYGRTINPWNKARSAGGSSGGAAAALASGQTFLEVGSDLGGSIRQPAHCCGVWGHKPTTGVVSQLGHAPPPMPPAARQLVDSPLLNEGLPVVGPMARTANDIALALSVLAGPVMPQARALSWSMPTPRATELMGLRVGYVIDDPSSPVSPEVGDVLERLIAGLARAGVKLRKGWPDGIDPVRQRDIRYYFRANLGILEDPENQARVEKAKASLPKKGWPPGDPFAIFARAATDGLDARMAVETERLMMRVAWERYFGDVDLFLSPVFPTTAQPHDSLTEEIENRNHIWFAAATIIGLPALSAPVGIASDGMPVNVQIHGAMYDDATPIAFGAMLTRAGLGGYRKPPGV